ncbi:hypothetical protein GO639_09795 [Staphylococcus aureus]|nr:hypothetical protein [Staphylococcus aureus]
MRDRLPSSGPKQNETAIVNLDGISGPGTHWVAYKKCGKEVTYFDSFGDLPPPLELTRFFRKCSNVKIKYNYDRQQKFNTVLCGHLCLQFLSK